MSSKGFANDQNKGFAVNLGGRFVTLGGSVMLSYWKTESTSPSTNELSRQMFSFNLGGRLWKIVANYDFLWAKKEFETSKSDEFEFDEIRGAHGKKPKLAVLNKKKLSSYEMDELFLDF